MSFKIILSLFVARSTYYNRPILCMNYVKMNDHLHWLIAREIFETIPLVKPYLHDRGVSP